MSTATDISSRVGETLLLLQKLEALLQAALIVALEKSDSDEKLRLLLKRDRETMGMLLRHMKNRVELPSEFADTLDRLLEKRNIFVHKLFLQDWFNLNTAEGRGRVDAFINDLLKDAAVAVRIFTAYSSVQKKDGSSEIPCQVKEVFDYIIERIFFTASPDFGGKTPDEYLKDFTESAQIDYAQRLRQKT